MILVYFLILFFNFIFKSSNKKRENTKMYVSVLIYWISSHVGKPQLSVTASFTSIITEEEHACVIKVRSTYRSSFQI